MTDDERISTSRRIEAPAARIFDVITRPTGHVEIDGSGMLIAADGASPVTAVGDTFAMHMDRRPLGDIPNLAEYDVTVVILGFEKDALLEWSVLNAQGEPYGHVYSYRLEPVGGGSATVVTSSCDWSGLAPELKNPERWPIVPLHMLESSLENLERVVTR